MKMLSKSSLEAKEWYTFGIAACIPRVNRINIPRTCLEDNAIDNVPEHMK